MSKKGKIVYMYQSAGDTPQGYEAKIESLVKTFEKEFPEEFDLEDVIEFTVNAWNYSNLKGALTEDELVDFKDMMMLESTNDALFEQIVALKKADFPDDDQIIEDFEMKTHEDRVTLILETMSRSEYVETYIDEFDAEGAVEVEDEEGFINRYAVILKAQAPFVAWLKAMDPEESLPERLESNVYLIKDEVRDLNESLRDDFDTYFKLELDEWTEDESEWPENRTFEMFKEWFSVDVSTMIYDMENDTIYKD